MPKTYQAEDSETGIVFFYVFADSRDGARTAAREEADRLLERGLPEKYRSQLLFAALPSSPISELPARLLVERIVEKSLALRRALRQRWGADDDPPTPLERQVAFDGMVMVSPEGLELLARWRRRLPLRVRQPDSPVLRGNTRTVTFKVQTTEEVAGEIGKLLRFQSGATASTIIHDILVKHFNLNHRHNKPE